MIKLLLDFFIAHNISIFLTITMVYLSIAVAIGVAYVTMKVYNALFSRLSVQPIFYCKNNKLTAYLLEQCPAFNKPFRPAAWLQNKHVQTVVPSLMRKWFTHGITFQREVLTVEDGEQLAVDWAMLDGNCETDSKDIIVVLPGMTASASSFCSTCLVGIQHGFRMVVFNKRGHGGMRITKPLLKGFGDSSDLQSVLKIIKSRYPDDRIGLIGSSAGSALLASYCTNYNHDSQIDVCIHHSPGYETRKLFEYPPYSKFYEYVLVRSLKHEVIWPNMGLLSGIVDESKVKSARTMVDLERDVYCKLNGYKDMEEHWIYNNPDSTTWGKYSTPTLCVSALDDPICVAANIPFSKFKEHDHGLLMAVPKGGHCGFIEDLNGLHWTDVVMVEYIEHVLRYLREHDGETIY